MSLGLEDGLNLGDILGEAGLSEQGIVLHSKLHRICCSSMGAGSILCWNNDGVGVAFSTNKDTGDELIFGSSKLVPAQDRDGVSIAVVNKVLSESDTAIPQGSYITMG